MSEENKNINNETATAEKKQYSDRWLWGIFWVLIAISVVESFSASSQNVAKLGIMGVLWGQAKFLIFGVGLAWVIERIHYRHFIAPIVILTFVSILALALVDHYGALRNGARRAYEIGGLSIMPNEIAKFALAGFLAFIMTRCQKKADISTGGLLICVIAVLFTGWLLIKQGLTNAVILILGNMVLIFVGGTSMKKVLLVLVLSAVGFLGLHEIKKHNERSNEASFQKEMKLAESAPNPTAEKELVLARYSRSVDQVNRSATRSNRTAEWFRRDSLIYDSLVDQNAQAMVARFAQARGGWVGKGPSLSTESSRLRLAFSDFIFSIIVEEFGFIGGIALFLLFILLLCRAGRVAAMCSRTFPALLVMSMAITIVLQAIFHMAINTGASPVSGQPLPLISAGGTSILMTCVGFGVMFSVSRHIRIDAALKKKSKHDSNTSDNIMDKENLAQI